MWIWARATNGDVMKWRPMMRRVRTTETKHMNFHLHLLLRSHHSLGHLPTHPL